MMSIARDRSVVPADGDTCVVTGAASEIGLAITETGQVIAVDGGATARCIPMESAVVSPGEGDR